MSKDSKKQDKASLAPDGSMSLNEYVNRMQEERPHYVIDACVLPGCAIGVVGLLLTLVGILALLRY